MYVTVVLGRPEDAVGCAGAGVTEGVKICSECFLIV